MEVISVNTGLSQQLVKLISSCKTLKDSALTQGLKQLRSTISTAIAAFKASPDAHAGMEEILEAAALLWNESLGMESSEGDGGSPSSLLNASMKQASLDLQSAVLDTSKLSLSHQLRLTEHALKTGELWGELERWEAADAALALFMTMASALTAAATSSGTPAAQQERCAATLFSGLIQRLRAALRLGQELPASALLFKLKELSTHPSLPKSQLTMFGLDLLSILAAEGERLVEGGKHVEAAQILQAAHDAHGGLQAASTEMHAAGVAEEVCTIGARVLVLLGWSHLEAAHTNAGPSGGAGAALRCVQALERHSQRSASSIAVPLLTHRALLLSGRTGEAETELLKVVTHEDATPAACASAIKAALRTPGGEAGARTALATALENSQGEDLSAFVLDLAEAVLAPGRSTSKGGDKESADVSSFSPVAQDVILELLEDDSVQDFAASDGAAQRRLHTLCWNAGCNALERDAPEEAARYYAVAAAFASQGDVEAAVEAQMAQAMALCGAQDFNGATQHLKDAENAAPGRLSVAFLRLKACLAAGDQDAAAGALQALAGAEGCDAEMLRAACCVAMESGMRQVAEAALEALLRRVQALGDGARSVPGGYEATVFQNLVSLLDGENDAGCGERLQDLRRLLVQLAQRISVVGADTFFAGAEGHRQLQWFELTAWNAGCSAAKAGDCESAAALIALSGNLNASQPSPDAATLRRRHLAYVMAAAAALESPGSDALANSAHHIAAAFTASSVLDGLQVVPGEQDIKTRMYCHLLEFSLGVRRRNADQAIEAVNAAKRLPSSSAAHFLKMAEMCCADSATKCPEARKAALIAALERMTSQISMDYAEVARTFRALLELCSGDEERLKIIRDAAAVLASAPPSTDADAYPPLEARWMATTTWNRGATHFKFSRVDEGKSFMGLALRLAKHAGAAFTEEEKAKMGEEYECVKAAAPPAVAGGSGGGAAGGEEGEAGAAGTSTWDSI